MNPLAAPALEFWWRFALILSLEILVMVVIAAGLHAVMASPAWRRTIWQVCALGMLILVCVEANGASRMLATLVSADAGVPLRATSQKTFSVSMMEAPGGAPDAALPPASAISAVAPNKHSWWPGVLWLSASAFLIARMLSIRLLFLLRATRARNVSDPQLIARVEQLATRLGLRRPVRVIEMSGLRGPIAFGIVRLAIGLPKDFSTFGVLEQDAMLIHELAHLAARDPVWYVLIDFVAALVWWHPLSWWIRRQLHAATEAAADEACVLVEEGPDSLAEALVKLGSRLLERQRLSLLGLGGSGFRSSVGRRVERLMKLNGAKWRPVPVAFSALTKVAGPVLLPGVALCCSAWIVHQEGARRDSGWADSLAGRAMSAMLQVAETVRSPAETFVGAQAVAGRSSTNTSSKPQGSPELHTRAFKVDPLAFMRRLQDTIFSPSPQESPEGIELPAFEFTPRINPERPAPEDRSPTVRHVEVVNNLREQMDLIRAFLLASGVEIAGSKAIFWSDRQGVLLVRATLDDLDVIERSLQLVNAPPPQVVIEVKIAEIPDGAGKQLGFDWLGTGVRSTISTNQPGNAFAGPHASPNLAFVLTAAQYQTLIKAMEQKAGVDLLAAPKVTTLSARQAQIKVVEIKNVVTGVAQRADQKGVFDLLVREHECGPMIDAVAVVGADGYTIDLTLGVTLREFLGYEPTNETVKVLNDDGTIGSAPKPLPRFRVHQAVATPRLWDGQTAAVGLGKVEGKERVAFVTLSIIDPAGNLVHGEGDGEFRTRGIPTQQ